MRPPGRHAVPWILILGLLLCGCRDRPPPFGYDFEKEADLDALRWKCGTLFVRSDRHATSGRFSLRADLHPSPPGADEDYPGVVFPDFDPDWSGFKTLAVDIFVPAEQTVRLVVRIDDRLDEPPYADRYNHVFELSPGPNRLRIPLDTLETSGTRRLLDLRRIEAAYFFVTRPAVKTRLYFDHFRLLP